MRTIADHRADIHALVAPVLGGLSSGAGADRGAGAGAGAGSGSGSPAGGGVGDPPGRAGARSVTLAAIADRPDHRAVLAHDVLAPIDLPPFDNSQMDGFALRAADVPGTLAIGTPIAAGAAPGALPDGVAAPIMTGAPIPRGADVVVPVEAVGPGRFPQALHETSLAFPAAVAGTFVRRRGSDVRQGDVLIAAGASLTPARLGLLAAAGIERVGVVRPPRVLVVSTGSEVAASGPDARGTIGDANGTSLHAALAEVGVEARAIRVPDDESAFLAAVDEAVGDWADLVVTTGGISEGAYEVVRGALEPRGLVVTVVAMQPGGPQAFGTVTLAGRPVPVVAFPGNPVSALVSFEVFLRPLLAAHAGLSADRPTSQVPSSERATSPSGKHQIRRGVVTDGVVRFVGGPSSHLLASYADATHLVHVPIDTTDVEPGDPLTVWRIA